MKLYIRLYISSKIPAELEMVQDRLVLNLDMTVQPFLAVKF